MFGIDSSEFAVVALVALLVIGPKDLPRVMRQVGQWLAKGRAMTRHVRAGFDTMMREAELEDMQKAWAAQNDAIMKATALPDLGVRTAMTDHAGPVQGADDWMLPPPPLAPETVDVATSQTIAAPKRRRKAVAAAPADAAASAKPPRKRAAKKPAEPQPTE